MKKLLLALLTSALLLYLSGCGGGILHCRDCDDTNIYKEGYCKYHYTLHTIGKGMDEIGKTVYDTVDSILSD